MAVPSRFRVAVIVCSAMAFTSCTSSPAQVATSPAHVAVPRSAANTYPAEATASLCKAGLRPLYIVAPTLVRAGTNDSGYAVDSISPAPGSKVQAGSVVKVTLGRSVNAGPGWHGPRPRAVIPDVKGLDANSALGEITTLGLFANVTTTTPTGALTVTSQTPAAGTTVNGGSTVTLRIGNVGSEGCP